MNAARAALAAVMLGALTSGAAMAQDNAQARLETFVAGDGEPAQAAPGAAIAIWIDGEVVWSAAAGAAAFEMDGVTATRPLRPDTVVRAASISKLAVALTALSLAKDGVVDLDAPITPLLGFELPVAPADLVTIRSALAHTSGICDPDVYWALLGEPLSDLMDDSAACAHAPGEDWAYANINYALVAQALETATGERFDHLAQEHVLTPLGLHAGFNWSGVAPNRRAQGATLYRREDGRWIAQIDDADILADSAPELRRAPGAVLADYVPGTNGSLFSPQGGLRASVEDLARLAAAFLPHGPGAALTEPVWTGDAWPGVRAYGPGPQIMTAGQFSRHRDLEMVGHAGEAYGLYGGAWAIPSRNAAIAYFVTGSDPDGLVRDPASGFTGWETGLLEIALDALAEIDTASHQEP